MFDLFKNSLKDFSKTYKKYIAFEFIYMLMTGFIFVPIIAYVFNRILVAMGTGPLLNSDIFKIALSSSGIIGLIIISILSIIVVFIEFGVLIVISQKKFFSKKIAISEAFITMIRKTPKIFGFGILHLMLFQLLLVPFIDLPLSSSLIENIDLPIFIREEIVGSYILLMLYSLVFLAVIYLLLRWIFTLHYIIIEGKPTREAIASSLMLTQHNRIRILLKLFFFNIVIFMIGAGVFYIINLIPSFIDIDQVNREIYFIENYFITLSSLLTYVFLLLLIPVNIIFLTRLYYQFKRRQGLPLQDDLFTYKSNTLERLEDKIAGLFGRKKILVLLILAINLVATFFLSYSVNENMIYIGRNVLIAAHRGDPINAPENSLSSVKKALEQQVDYVEIDVQKTKDGIIVLNHDIDLRRVAGVAYNVPDLTYEEILEFDIGNRFSQEFKGERIPTLEEVLREVKGEAKIIIDLKPYGHQPALAKTVVELVEDYDMVEDSYVQSFDYSLLEIVRSLNSNIKIGQIMYFAAGDLSTLDVDYYVIEQRMLSNKFIRSARRKDREVWVWTVNSEEDIKEVLRYDIDGIITDYPRRVQEIIGFYPLNIQQD